MARLWDSGALYAVWGEGRWYPPHPFADYVHFDAQGALETEGLGSCTVFLRGGGTVSAIGGFGGDVGDGGGDFVFDVIAPGYYHPDSYDLYTGDGSSEPVRISVSGHTPVGGAVSGGRPPFWMYHIQTVETGVAAPTGLVPAQPVPTQRAMSNLSAPEGFAHIYDFGPITDPTARLVAVYTHPDFPWIGGTVENTLVPLGGAVVTPMDVPISFFDTEAGWEGLALPSRHGLLGIRTATGMKYVPFIDADYTDFLHP